MDEKLQEYLNTLAKEVLASPSFANIPSEQKDYYLKKVLDELNNTIFDSLLDNLNNEQLNELKTLGLGSPEAQKRIEEFSEGIPDFVNILEAALKLKVEKLKTNPQELV